MVTHRRFVVIRPFNPHPFRGDGSARPAPVIDPVLPVEVYRNLRPGHSKLPHSDSRTPPWYSVRQGGRVVGHALELALRDATFVVRAAGRERVLATGRKNVHAWVRGWLVDPIIARTLGPAPVPVTYDPRRFSSFVRIVGGERVDWAAYVYIGPSGVLAYAPDDCS